jgi:histidinol-phosphate aminotransferase
LTEPDARHDMAALAAAVTERTRLVLLCSPNNPTGPALTAAEVAQFMDRIPASVLVVLDEAYTQFVTAADAADGLDLLPHHPNLVSLRTFSKAYGLAGLRVGYAVARSRTAAAIRAASTPFGVNALAQVAAVASLGMEDAMRERVAGIVRQRDRMAGALGAQGWQIPQAQGNFVWLPLGEATVAFNQAASSAGVLVRPFAGEGVRVSAGEPEGIDALLAITPSWL